MNSCKHTRPLAAAAFCAAILSAIILDSSSSKAAAASLFDPATAAQIIAAAPRAPSGGTMRDGLRSPETVLRDRLVSLNTGELARVVPAGADYEAADSRLARGRGLSGAVTLDLFPGVSVTAQRTDLEAPEEGGFVWVGEDRGSRHAFVTLVINNNGVVGQIQTGGKLYSIEPVSGAVHRIIEINQAKIRDDLHPPRLPDSNDKKGEGPQPAPEAVAPLATKTTIKVLVANTITARNECGAGTVAQKQTCMQSRITMAISLANQAFTRSGVQITFLRVGGANEISYNDTGLYGGNTFANYVGALCDLSGFPNNGSCAGIGNNNTAKFAALRTKRDTMHADLVVLMRKEGAACGIAWEPNLNGTVLAGNNIYGFSVSTSSPSYGCLESNTLAHETGHNQGLNHDRIQHKIDYSLPTPPASQYNFGHVNTSPPIKFYTIMSYQSSCPVGCTRIPYFSTPLRKYPPTAPNEPVGVAQGIPGIFGAADNVRRLNLNRGIVSNYRTP